MEKKANDDSWNLFPVRVENFLHFNCIPWYLNSTTRFTHPSDMSTLLFFLLRRWVFRQQRKKRLHEKFNRHFRDNWSETSSVLSCKNRKLKYNSYSHCRWSSQPRQHVQWRWVLPPTKTHACTHIQDAHTRLSKYKFDLSQNLRWLCFAFAGQHSSLTSSKFSHPPQKLKRTGTERFRKREISSEVLTVFLNRARKETRRSVVMKWTANNKMCSW